MSMAGASGDRWAIRTHPFCAAAGAAGAVDAAAVVAATRATVPQRSVMIAASRAKRRSNCRPHRDGLVRMLPADAGLRLSKLMFAPQAALRGAAIEGKQSTCAR